MYCSMSEQYQSSVPRGWCGSYLQQCSFSWINLQNRHSAILSPSKTGRRFLSSTTSHAGRGTSWNIVDQIGLWSFLTQWFRNVARWITCMHAYAYITFLLRRDASENGSRKTTARTERPDQGYNSTVVDVPYETNVVLFPESCWPWKKRGVGILQSSKTNRNQWFSFSLLSQDEIWTINHRSSYKCSLWYEPYVQSLCSYSRRWTPTYFQTQQPWCNRITCFSN